MCALQVGQLHRPLAALELDGVASQPLLPADEVDMVRASEVEGESPAASEAEATAAAMLAEAAEAEAAAAEAAKVAADAEASAAAAAAEAGRVESAPAVASSPFGAKLKQGGSKRQVIHQLSVS